MTNEELALVNRLTACKRWRLIPGIVARDKNNAVFVFVGYHTDGQEMWAGPSGWLAGSALTIDITSPATLGCLLTLIREAWNDPGLYTVPLSSPGSVVNYLWHIRGNGSYIAKRSYTTEIAALVAALEVAP